jgi:hypothetical protein
MGCSAAGSFESKNHVDAPELTNETLTSRDRLSLCVRYVQALPFYSHLKSLFWSICRSRQGQSICSVFKACRWQDFSLDGTRRHVLSFDAVREDQGKAWEPPSMLNGRSSWVVVPKPTQLGRAGGE